MKDFLAMGGYGVYIWTAYISTFLCLAIQWYIPWRRWHKNIKQLKQSRKQ